jgi:DNA-3-methyladenine glycosylase
VAPDPPVATRRVVERQFLAGDSLVVAPRLLNLLLVRGGRAGRIVEVEAYRGAEDAASHAYRGRTARNATMFGPAGHLYVYFTYGMHYCANVVCGEEGTASAVLLRALRPVEGLEEMRAARHGVGDRALCSGPARLCQAFGIERGLDGADLVEGDLGIELLDDGTPAPDAPLVGARVGLSAQLGDAFSYPWRFAVPGSEHLSRRFPPAVARQGGRGR